MEIERIKMTKRKILTVIPARGGSKGIQRKNIRKLNGKPLIYYAINAGKNAKNIGKLIVSTDDKEFAEIAISYGVEIPFLRPPELAADMTTLIHVMRHALLFFDEIGESYDAVLSLQVTDPLIRSSTIDAVVEKFHAKKCAAVTTVSKIRHGHPYLSKRLVGSQKDEIVDFVQIPDGIVLYPRQKRETTYYCNGAVFLRDRSLLENLDSRNNCLGDKPSVVIMDDNESVNIDDMIDFKLAELLLQETPSDS